MHVVVHLGNVVLPVTLLGQCFVGDNYTCITVPFNYEVEAAKIGATNKSAFE